MPRRTKQKDAIASAISKNHQPLKIEEIHRLALLDVPSLGIATVYRTLKSLIEEGNVKVVELPGQPPHYEQSNKKHHHHFFCNSCNGVFELEPTCTFATVDEVLGVDGAQKVSVHKTLEASNSGATKSFPAVVEGEDWFLEKCLHGIQQLAPSGFQVTDHEITLYGSCANCAHL